MERLKGWVSKEGTPCRYFKFQQQTDQRHVYVEEIPDNAIRSEGLSTTGHNLLLSTDFPALEERQVYEIILIPKRKF